MKPFHWLRHLQGGPKACHVFVTRQQIEVCIIMYSQFFNSAKRELCVSLLQTFNFFTFYRAMH